MKKTYIIPGLTVMQVETQNIIALSLLGEADNSEVLVKGGGDWDIFSSPAEEEVISGSPYDF